MSAEREDFKQKLLLLLRILELTFAEIIQNFSLIFPSQGFFQKLLDISAVHLNLSSK
jgi:hypothetical protein